jgi:DeoR/GlpR family transcriptional regulator of sugar metabolism
MFPFERHEIILESCRNSKSVSINELLHLTGCSLSTLRRDIDHLMSSGQIRKLRGGISCVDKLESKGNLLYEQRMKLFSREKEVVGIAAQEYIQDGDILVLLYGTTTIQVARHIDPNKHITLITNGIDVLLELRNKPNVKVIALGGIINYSNNCIEGPTVPRMLQEFNPAKIILGAGGITEKKGITNYEFLGATYVTEIAKLVEKKIVVADHSKFGRDVLTNVMPFEDVSTFVTDAGISKEYIDIMEKHSIEYKISDLTLDH